MSIERLHRICEAEQRDGVNARADVAGGGDSRELDLSAGGQIVDGINQDHAVARHDGECIVRQRTETAERAAGYRRIELFIFRRMRGRRDFRGRPG